jgi:hypothetical protein
MILTISPTEDMVKTKHQNLIHIYYNCNGISLLVGSLFLFFQVFCVLFFVLMEHYFLWGPCSSSFKFSELCFLFCLSLFCAQCCLCLWTAHSCFGFLLTFTWLLFNICLEAFNIECQKSMFHSKWRWFFFSL